LRHQGKVALGDVVGPHILQTGAELVKVLANGFYTSVISILRGAHPIGKTIEELPVHPALKKERTAIVDSSLETELVDLLQLLSRRSNTTILLVISMNESADATTRTKSKKQKSYLEVSGLSKDGSKQLQEYQR
jgi:hypothetical protein